MNTITTILVDTSAWYALAAADDAHHPEAKKFYQSQRGKARWVATDLILAETFTLLNLRLGRSSAIRFWETLRQLGTAVLCLDPVDLEAAWHITQAWNDQSFSLVDCTSFALMERLGITQVFAFDQHFLIYRYGLQRQLAFQRMPR